YLSAAHLTRQDANPYNSRLLVRTETHLLGQQGLRVVEPRLQVRVANPPLFFWLLGPLTALPFRAAVVLWDLSVLASAAAGILGFLAFFGWQRRLLPVLVFLAMPMVV